jgi:hypothetical protein
MKPYSRLARCERCSAKFTFVATRRDSGKAVTVVKVPCPSCKSPVTLEVSCDLDESTIQVVGFERSA